MIVSNSGDMYIIHYRQEMIEFIKLKEIDFDSYESWLSFFGIDLRYHPNTGEYLETFDQYVERGGEVNIPNDNEYPVALYYLNEASGRDRIGKYGIQVYDWISLNQM